MSDTFKELSQQTEQGRGAVASSLAENLEALELKQFSPFFGGQQCQGETGTPRSQQFGCEVLGGVTQLFIKAQ